MFNIGGGELVVIAIVALIVLGPDRLPSAARDVGKMMTELRSMSRGFRQELSSAMQIPEEDEAEAAAYRRGDEHVAQRPPAGQAPVATEQPQPAATADDPAPDPT